MSFRGGGRGGDRGGRGGGFRGSDRGGFRGGARGGRGGFQSYGPPDQVLEMGNFLHATEGEMVCSSINTKIPYFNAPIYLENKTPVGKVDEILGPLNQVYFTIKPQEGIQATSFKAGDKFYIGGDKLLPLDRFLPKPKPLPGAPKVKKPRGAGFAGRGDGAVIVEVAAVDSAEEGLGLAAEAAASAVGVEAHREGGGGVEVTVSHANLAEKIGIRLARGATAFVGGVASDSRQGERGARHEKRAGIM
ncbi:hypothetical protein B0A55_10196 [Friedmanniomyces simplex]|uniref:H/ACA ribonucleoprotein complex subunit n=1 Tax=Friedmanniomyces simplex TaxID=329884 RepID=A0A4U0WL38_9PEZI|nr:hypothetical protein B0A55_10196 [Friedmanniomyces simplex]